MRRLDMRLRELEQRFQTPRIRLKKPDFDHIKADFKIIKADIKRKTADIHLDDEARFILSWLGSPLKTGAVSPSGKALASAMADSVNPAIPGDVIELGPGTGPVTEALIARGIAEERLVLIEFNPDFCTLLRQRFPKARIVQGDAYAICKTLEGHLSGPAAAVVSSLPLVTRPDAECLNLVREAFTLLKPGAPYVQFTYGPVSPVPLKSGEFSAQPSKRIWKNLPPARVWVYRLAVH